MLRSVSIKAHNNTSKNLNLENLKIENACVNGKNIRGERFDRITQTDQIVSPEFRSLHDFTSAMFRNVSANGIEENAEK